MGSCVSPKNLTICTDAPPKHRREKTVAELTPGSRKAWGRGCRCAVIDFGGNLLIVIPGVCSHHRGISFWDKKEKRGTA